MKRIIKIGMLVLLAMMLITNTAFAEKVQYSERCMKAREAEKAILEKYDLGPEMLGYFLRNVDESPDGAVTVVLTGANDLYYVLGVYTGTSDGTKASASWSNEGKKTNEGFRAEAWDKKQLQQMVAISGTQRTMRPYYDAAMEIAEASDPDYKQPEEYHTLTEEFEWETTTAHPTHDEIEARSKFSKNELVEIARTAVQETYDLTDEQMKALETEEGEPDFRYVIEDDQLIYRAWLHLALAADEDDGITFWVPGDGSYVVVINAETGIVDDIIYDAELCGEG
jgi:hypothetical protein